MKDLILRTRLIFTQKSLREVDRIKDSVEQRRAEITNLIMGLTDSEESITSAANVVDKQLQSMDSSIRRLDLQEEKRQSIENALNEATSELEKIRDITVSSTKILKSMQARAVPISNDIRRTLQLELVKRAQTWTNKLEAIRTENIDKAEEAEQRGESHQAIELMKQAWDMYMTEVYKESEPVFAEYVDLLRGLALRDAGFDAGICQIADELISGCDMVPDVPRWESLTIPSREEAISMTLARIIRLGFPEWSIFALPLAAHEFGHVVVGNNPTLQDFIRNEASDEADEYRLQEYLADAFATYAMGPAYVYAAILLRLDPMMAYQDVGGSPASAKRAHVMFAMLKRMDDKATMNRPYEEVIKTLEEEWVATLHQVGQSGSLEDHDRVKLEKYVAHIDHFLDEASLVAYSHEAWMKSTKWAGTFLDAEDSRPKVRGDEELRDVLNAAWVCRVNERSGLHGVDTIQRTARKLWQQIKDQRRASGEGGVYGWKI